MKNMAAHGSAFLVSGLCRPRETERLGGGAADGARVVTKAGGFGDEAAVADIVQELLHS